MSFMYLCGGLQNTLHRKLCVCPLISHNYSACTLFINNNTTLHSELCFVKPFTRLRGIFSVIYQFSTFLLLVTLRVWINCHKSHSRGPSEICLNFSCMFSLQILCSSAQWVITYRDASDLKSYVQ